MVCLDERTSRGSDGKCGTSKNAAAMSAKEDVRLAEKAKEYCQLLGESAMAASLKKALHSEAGKIRLFALPVFW